MSIDWTIEIGAARKRVGNQVALQGNLDPAILYAKPEVIRAEVQNIMHSYGTDNTGHIFNLGHGIQQDTPPENVAVLVEAVQTA
jgi:uroporphyrinogen decarboxylase